LRGQGKAYLLRRREPPHYGRRPFNIMALMDMPDQARVLREIHRVLGPGAFLQFSILHPCFDPPYRKVLGEADGRARNRDRRLF